MPPGSGLSVSSEVYSSNLQYLKNNVIPKGWALNAVVKWNAYGHDIPSLAGAATKLGLSVSVLTNKEARDVLAASQAAGVSKPVIWRIMPAEGPAKYTEILEAAQAGLDVQVGGCHAVVVLGRLSTKGWCCIVVPHEGLTRYAFSV